MGEGTDLLKYVTNRVAVYLTTPVEPREEDARPSRLPWTTQWFGMIPMGVQLWLGDRRPKPTVREGEAEL